MNPLRQAVKSMLTAVLPPRLLMTHGPASSRAVALTFDDGPHPEHTPRVLDQLARYDVHATFFVVGKCAAEHPDLVRRIVGEGHDLGHHSYFHDEPDTVSANQLMDEVRRCRELLENLTGHVSLLFRPPKGKLTFSKMSRLWKQQQAIILWNIDPRDYLRASQAEIETWCANYRPTGGNIVLLHDNCPRAAEAIPQIAKRVRSSGLTFARISDWLPRASLTPVAVGGT